MGGYVGGDEVQRNFLIRAAIVAQKAGIDGLYIYVLWAKTSGSSEMASAQYQFPASFAMKTATQFDWKQTQTLVSVTLTGSPVFIKP